MNTTHHDPLMEAIAAFREADTIFNETATDDDGSPEEDRYYETLHVLYDWDRPAMSREGAIEALKIALEETRDFHCPDAIPAMLEAAIGYFEKAVQ